jgi:cysteine-rich repeat protein
MSIGRCIPLLLSALPALVDGCVIDVDRGLLDVAGTEADGEAREPDEAGPQEDADAREGPERRDDAGPREDAETPDDSGREEEAETPDEVGPADEADAEVEAEEDAETPGETDTPDDAGAEEDAGRSDETAPPEDDGDVPPEAPEADDGDGEAEVDVEAADDGEAEAEAEVPAAVCGNGVVETGEQCDDGPSPGGDGCEPDCTWTCESPADCDDDEPCNGEETCDVDHVCEPGTPPAPGSACTTGGGLPGTCRDLLCAEAGCGNGIPEGDEQCDDGDADNTDDCLSNCRDASCGDGYVWAGNEECDGDPARSCTTSCLSSGTQQCAHCAWAACTPPGESCNGTDDDCDTVPDNGYDCVGGTSVPCTTTCGSTGTGPCTASCEIPEGTSCVPPAAETCNGIDDDCDGWTDEDSCLPQPHATVACVPPGCAVAACDGGWLNCNGAVSDGCECGSTAHADPSCEAGACVPLCIGTWGNCNGLAGDGCETDLRSITTCGTDCASVTNCPMLPNVLSAACPAGVCQINSCDEGWVECNGSVPDGCERHLDSGPGDCGAATDLGWTYGDVEGGPSLAGSGTGEAWVKFQLVEANGWSPAHDLSATIELTVPTYVDYDLAVDCQPGDCGSGGLVAETPGQGVHETVVVTWVDDVGTDDSRWVYVEIVFRGAATRACGDWGINVRGNDVPGMPNC